MMPSVPVEVREGVICHARDADADAELEARTLELFRRVGTVVTVDEAQIEVATGLMSCAPAYIALVAEAQVDAGVRAGMPADVAGELVAANIAGTAALLQARGMDTLAVRRSVMSPGGLTARGLAALEHAGLRAAFDDAMQAVLRR
jgi:pyrroline-5-carboxylate reductase